MPTGSSGSGGFALEPGEIQWFADIPLTIPVRTAVDVARRSGVVPAVIALDTMLTASLIAPAAVAAYAIERSTLHGVYRLPALLGLARRGPESPMETRTRLLIVRAGLPTPEVQHPVYDREGRFVGRLDLAYPDRRLGIEYDGDHHRDRMVFQRDAMRLNRFRLAGWTILRFTAEDVLRYPERVPEQVRLALRAS